MPELLQFRYKPGEHVIHETVSTSVFKSEEGEKTEKKMRFRVSTECTIANDEVFTIRARTHVLEAEGIQASPSQLRPGPVAVYTMAPAGNVVRLINPNVPVTADLILPPYPVDVGDFWEVSGQGDKSSPITMEVQVEALEQQGKDYVAILSCGGQTDIDEGGASAFVEGSIHFSITQGRKLWSQMLCSLSWKTGRKVDMTEECTYLGPAATLVEAAPPKPAAEAPPTAPVKTDIPLV